DDLVTNALVASTARQPASGSKPVVSQSLISSLRASACWLAVRLASVRSVPFGTVHQQRAEGKATFDRQMGTKLYVGNLSYSTTEASLRAAFEGNGRQVKEVAVISDRETGRPRGFAFVRMATEADAQAAISEMDGADLDGRRIRVNEAQERSPQ